MLPNILQLPTTTYSIRCGTTWCKPLKLQIKPNLSSAQTNPLMPDRIWGVHKQLC